MVSSSFIRVIKVDTSLNVLYFCLQGHYWLPLHQVPYSNQVRCRMLQLFPSCLSVCVSVCLFVSFDIFNDDPRWPVARKLSSPFLNPSPCGLFFGLPLFICCCCYKAMRTKKKKEDEEDMIVLSIQSTTKLWRGLGRSSSRSSSVAIGINGTWVMGWVWSRRGGISAQHGPFSFPFLPFPFLSPFLPFLFAPSFVFVSFLFFDCLTSRQ